MIRADAGVSVGTGHVMRAIALAQAIMDRGGVPIIVAAECPVSVQGRVRSAGIPLELLDGCEPGDEKDSELTIAAATAMMPRVRWVVLDGYHFGVDYQRSLRDRGLNLLCVDDYGHCDVWACDVLLNQNLGVEKRPRVCEVKPFTQLLGAKFTLLRREFRACIPAMQSPRSGRIKRILISMGGVDASNASSAVLDVLEQVRGPALNVRILAGIGNPHLESLRARVSRHHLEVKTGVTDMPAEYQWADGIVSAGGGSCWEWLFFGLRGCVVTIADNQGPVTDELGEQGLALALGWFHELGNPDRIESFEAWLESETSSGNEKPPMTVVDGRGACRVAAFLDECPLFIRSAGADDLITFFHWANDSAVRANAFHPDPIRLADHTKWFLAKLASPKSRLFLAELVDGTPVGQIRFDLNEDGSWLLSYSLSKEHRGKRLGGHLLAEGIRAFRDYVPSCPEIVGKVKAGNTSSCRVLVSVGFAKRAVAEDHEYYLIPATASN